MKIIGSGQGKVGVGIGIPYIRDIPSKKYSLVLDLNKTLVYYNEDGKVILRDGLYSFMDLVKPFYELISFGSEQKHITDCILKEIEKEKKFFDYNLNRDNCIIYENNLVKDISLIGRDISKIIVIDDDENCFKLNKENGIKIKAFNGKNKDDNGDNALIELKKILILIYKDDYDDIRVALKDFSNIIKKRISLS